MSVDDFGLGCTCTLTAAGPAHTRQAVGNTDRSPRKCFTEVQSTTYADSAELEVS